MKFDPRSVLVQEIETEFREANSITQFIDSDVDAKWKKHSGLNVEYLKAEILAAGGKDIPDWWSQNPTVWKNEFVYFKITDSIYLAEIGGVINQRNEMSALSYEEAKFLYGVNPSLDDSFNSLYKKGEVKLNEFDKALVTMPWGGIHNYGHFLLDCLVAVNEFASDFKGNNTKFVFPPLKQYQVEYLHLIDVSWVEVRGINSFNEIYYSNIMNHYLHFPNDSTNSLRDKILNKLGSKYDVIRKDGPKKIFIVRRDKTKRRFVNEIALSNELEKIGFTPIDPSEFSVEEQIVLFLNADAIIGSSGAAFANILWCKPGTKIIDIQSENAQQVWIRNLSLQVGLRYAAYFTEAKPAGQIPIVGGVPRPEMGFSFEIDLQDFLNFVFKVV
jgi:capsular polysaccharide biosynthesis protein